MVRKVYHHGFSFLQFNFRFPPLLAKILYLMETNPHQKDAARNLFLHTDKTRAEIADIIDINSKTLYLWIKHGRWDEMKTAARQTPSMLLQDVYDHIEAINNKIKSREDRCPTYQEVEMLRKLFASTKHIQKLNLGTYVEAFTELTSFINSHDHALGVKVLNLTDQYIKGLANPRPAAYGQVADVTTHLEKMKEQEEQEIEALQQTVTPATTTATIIPLSPIPEAPSTDIIAETPAAASTQNTPIITLPVPTHPTALVFCRAFLKNTSSRFARPPLTHRYLGLLTRVVGHHRAFFHFISHSKPNN